MTRRTSSAPSYRTASEPKQGTNPLRTDPTCPGAIQHPTPGIIGHVSRDPRRSGKGAPSSTTMKRAGTPSRGARLTGNGRPASVGQVPAAAVEPFGLPDAAGCGCSSGVSPERDDPPGHGAGTRARSLNRAPWRRRVLSRRKPRLSLRLPGPSWLRFGVRQFLALLFQLPPRFTRFEPDTAVTPTRGRPRTAARGPCGYQHDRHGRPCRGRSAPGRLRRYGPECSPLRGRACGAAGAPCRCPTSHDQDSS